MAAASTTTERMAVTLDRTMAAESVPSAVGMLRTGVLLGVSTARRGAEVALALPRIALALERLADSADDLRRLADTGDELRRLLRAASSEDLVHARETLQRVAETVAQLNLAVASLNTTVSPLQGATERLGRLVDRLPQRGRRVFEVGADGGPEVREPGS
jgi:ABC-type transporter Mla subunit MlaD